MSKLSDLWVVNFLKFFFVLAFREFSKFFTVFDQGENCLLLLVVFNVRLIFKHKISHKLVYFIIESNVDSCLIKNITFLIIFNILYSNFEETKC